MHEYSLSIDIIDTVLKVAKENASIIVNSVKIKIDPFVNASPIQLDFCLKILAKGTIAENSIFIFEFLNINLKCLNGHHKIIPFNYNKNIDIYTLLTKLITMKCQVCNKSMDITNQHSIYVDSIDIN